MSKPSSSLTKQVTIIGGGIVGMATAYRLMERWPKLKITILEKEQAVAQHQSTHNSGVLHAGLYYRPGSYRARLAVAGIRQMVQFCRDHEIPHDVCGKLVVATSEEEVPRMQALFERGQANGLEGLRVLESNEIRKIEPHVAGVAAIRVPEEGIVDYASVCATLAQKLREGGATIRCGARVTGFQRRKNEWVLETTNGSHPSELFVNCCGLHSDRVCRAAGERPQVKIVPFRGEYYKIKKERQDLVRNLIYPVPDPRFPFLGVHFTRLIHGGVEAGPNAVLAFSREGYRFWQINVKDLADALTFPGLWRFLWRYREMCFSEFWQSLSPSRFCKNLQRLVPDIRLEDLETGGAGVRAQAMLPEGKLADDFQISKADNALHVLNAPSPAATASLAIGGEIASILESYA